MVEITDGSLVTYAELASEAQGQRQFYERFSIDEKSQTVESWVVTQLGPNLRDDSE